MPRAATARNNPVNICADLTITICVCGASIKGMIAFGGIRCQVQFCVRIGTCPTKPKPLRPRWTVDSLQMTEGCGNNGQWTAGCGNNGTAGSLDKWKYGYPY